ncbi:hypothetical protein QJU43_03830 [Pasteurella atlantica]|uniref:Uncharacterized protein n=2 Tax=Pasteurellaceae TaxID=712 RepID=A0ACC6HMH0_9PAST|nr:hypothetical protein [Pasteurella atlantica]MDP8033539.1 hypothetical protein [Pasteurella atlantica]MDP8035474.1 hypothetical protein [Pasteurella atlantica]MDP8037425.1 hypothetical protein [Pasteurella atlantica]MDP8047774.1 hypothetical protein [Pasteurella atlantica]MDP8049665.1 hypothetical protein [Pasteurella atlantica]
MQAIYLKDNISEEQYQMAVRVLEAMNIGVERAEKKLSESETKMSKEAFYAKIDRGLNTPLEQCRELNGEYKKELFG